MTKKQHVLTWTHSLILDGGRLSKVTILQRHLKFVSLCGQRQTLQCAYILRCEKAFPCQSEKQLPFVWVSSPYRRREKRKILQVTFRQKSRQTCSCQSIPFLISDLTCESHLKCMKTCSPRESLAISKYTVKRWSSGVTTSLSQSASSSTFWKGKGRAVEMCKISFKVGGPAPVVRSGRTYRRRAGREGGGGEINSM